MKELTVKMKDIVNKMLCEPPDGLPGNNVLLAAFLAIAAGYRGSAVQAVFFSTFWLVGHAKFFLKIGTKNTVISTYSAFTKSIFYF